jgi:hypothetical protein
VPPILLMKRTLDDLEDLYDFDDFDDSDETDDEEEIIEPQPKRLRNESPVAKEESIEKEQEQTGKMVKQTRKI